MDDEEEEEGQKNGEDGESRYAYTFITSRGRLGCALNFDTRKSEAAETS